MAAHHVTSGALVGAGATLTVPDQPFQFLDRADALLKGAEALSHLGPAESQATIFLASWCVELSLKAYLASKGLRKNELRHIQHNLTELWAEASKHGLPIPRITPRWCNLFSETHKTPYHQRYPTDAAGSIATNIQALIPELTALLKLVRQSLQ